MGRTAQRPNRDRRLKMAEAGVSIRGLRGSFWLLLNRFFLILFIFIFILYFFFFAWRGKFWSGSGVVRVFFGGLVG